MTKKLPTVYQQFIHKSRYARWLPEEKRREEWHETVGRYFDFFEKHLEKNCKYHFQNILIFLLFFSFLPFKLVFFQVFLI